MEVPKVASSRRECRTSASMFARNHESCASARAPRDIHYVGEETSNFGDWFFNRTALSRVVVVRDCTVHFAISKFNQELSRSMCSMFQPAIWGITGSHSGVYWTFACPLSTRLLVVWSWSLWWPPRAILTLFTCPSSSSDWFITLFYNSVIYLQRHHTLHIFSIDLSFIRQVMEFNRTSRSLSLLGSYFKSSYKLIEWNIICWYYQFFPI